MVTRHSVQAQHYQKITREAIWIKMTTSERYLSQPVLIDMKKFKLDLLYKSQTIVTASS